MTPERKRRMESAIAHRQTDLAVVMENIGDVHNIAAVMRTCDAVGVQDIYVVNTDQYISNVQQKAFGSSRSANRWVTVHQFDNLNDCIQELRGKYQKLYCTHLSSDTKQLYDLDFTKESIALVFGNEQKGVSAEMLQHCDGNFVIPQVGMIKSLNISVACAVTLYEAFRQKNKAGHYEAQKMSEAAADMLWEKWSQKVR
ncbi:MAG: RNA methyltransferase [Pseudopedobacter saltans]|uniref:tRNA (guanosine(18)-2'-O)-methyltransferase n=1 Tax=Pseudopedobacter saltans TaxID=151895 RepID=A0A2W5ERM5_9SPHI|nr:MAG: RNA methyltransferase [Pseudopedobacter saltans]